MDKESVVNMYKVGFSVDYICDYMYKYHNKFSKPHYEGANLIIPKPKKTKAECRLEVTKYIYEYVKNLRED